MTRKLKMAGVLAAVVAMSALTASSASATFTSEKYPATVSGTSTGDVFTAFGSTVKCTDNTFTGNLSAASTTLTVTPTYNKCTAFGLPETVNFTGCDFVLHNAAGATPITTDLICPAGVKGVDKTMFSSSSHSTVICHVVITPFTGKGGLTATNNGNHILIKGTFEGITAHQERTNFLCPAGTEDKAATYAVQTSGITIKGTNGSISVS